MVIRMPHIFVFALNPIDACERHEIDIRVNCLHLFSASAPIVRCGLCTSRTNCLRCLEFANDSRVGFCFRFVAILVDTDRWLLFLAGVSSVFVLSFSLSLYAVRQMSIHSDGKCIECPNFSYLSVCCAMLEFVLQIERKTIN